jgi:hypothetical protein
MNVRCTAKGRIQLVLVQVENEKGHSVHHGQSAAAGQPP